MWWKLFLQIFSGITGLYLAQNYIPGVNFNGPFFILPKDQESVNSFLTSLVFVGSILGILNHFIKPLIQTITLPLRIITLNLFSLFILMFIVWLTEIFSPELSIEGLKPLFLVSLIVWGIYFFLSKWLPERS